MSAESGGNKMVAIAVGVLAIGLATTAVLIGNGAGLTGFGQGVRSFMLDVRVGIAANPTLAIIIFAIAIMITFGLVFMGARSMMSGGGGGGAPH